MPVFRATESRQSRGIVLFPAILRDCTQWFRPGGGPRREAPVRRESFLPVPRLGRNMRVSWNGSLSFGLVSIPVGLAPATKPAARQSDVSFRLLHRECLTPIKQKRWCPTHDRELAPDEIVKGWEVAKGQFVLVEEARARGARAPRRLAHDRHRAVRPARRRRPDLDGPHVLPRAGRGAGAAPPVQAAARGDGGGGRRGRGPARPLRSRVALSRPRPRQGPRARDPLPRRGRLLAGRDRRGDGGDAGQEGRARPRAADRRGPPGAVRAGGARRAGTAATCASCSRRSSAARRSPRPSRSREPAPAVDLIEALKASVAAAKASSPRPKKAAAKPKAAAEKRPARKAARK